MLDNRLITLRPAGIIPRITKRAEETFLVKLDTAAFLRKNITAVSAPTVSPATDAPTVAFSLIDSVALGELASRASFLVSGGAAGYTGTAHFTVTFAGGTVREAEWALAVVAPDTAADGVFDSPNGLYLEPGGTGKKGRVIKQPADVVTVNVDFSKWLWSGDTISTGTPPALVFAPSLNAPTAVVTGNDTSVDVKLSAGSAGYAGTATLTVTTDGGEIKLYDIQVDVTDY